MRKACQDILDGELMDSLLHDYTVLEDTKNLKLEIAVHKFFEYLTEAKMWFGMELERIFEANKPLTDAKA